MNKNNAIMYVPLVVALADGHTIQIRKNLGGGRQIWEDLGGDIRFTAEPEYYRVKVAPLELHAVYNARGERLYVGEKKGFEAWMLRNDPRLECKYTFKKFVEEL